MQEKKRKIKMDNRKNAKERFIRIKNYCRGYF